MTEKNKQPEQKVAHYYRVGSVERSRGLEKVKQANKQHRLVSRSLQRVVKVPDSSVSDAGHSFDQRRQQELTRRVRSSKKNEVVVSRRTLAQTGSPAVHGLTKLPKRSLPYRSAIPQRARRKTTWRQLIWKFFSFFSVVTLCIFSIHFFFTSNTFRLETLQVKGSQNAALVKRIQQLETSNANIFFFNVESLKARVDALPLVAASEVSKQWPNQIVVKVVERKPVLLWQTSQGTFSVDQQGKVIAPAHETPGSNQLATVIDVTKLDTNVQAGTKTEPLIGPGTYIKQGIIPFALEVLQRAPKVTSVNVFKLHYDGTMYASTIDTTGGTIGSRGSFIIESPDGWKAYLGGAHDTNPLENRLLELREVLNLAQQKQLKLSTIDLRYGLRPVFTLQS